MTVDDPVGIPPEERSTDLGVPDVMTMQRTRDIVTQDEPLIEQAQFDSVLDPQELQIRFADGIGDAEWCRIDVTWYTSGAYRFHYTDSDGRNWRFDKHPNPHSAEKHFHQPPDASSETATQSCIQVEEPRLVARAVLKLWRRAYERGTFDEVNTAENPP